MNFISVREFRSKSAIVWKNLSKQGELIITCNGKPIAIISSTNEKNLEEELQAIRRARAQLAVQTMQLNSVKKGLNKLSQKDIENEITSARKTA